MSQRDVTSFLTHFDNTIPDIKYMILDNIMRIQHKENYKRTLEEIPLAGVNSRINHLYKIRDSTPQLLVSKFAHLLHIMVNDQEHIISALKTCGCCERHNQDHDRYRHDHTYIQSYKCVCNCRHLRRQMFNSINFVCTDS